MEQLISGREIPETPAGLKLVSKEIGNLEGVEGIEVIESSFGRKELHVHVKEKTKALLEKIELADKDITSHYPYFIGSTVFGKDVDEPEAPGSEAPSAPVQSSLGAGQ